MRIDTMSQQDLDDFRSVEGAQLSVDHSEGDGRYVVHVVIRTVSVQAILEENTD
jgi:hypothetical protein